MKIERLRIFNLSVVFMLLTLPLAVGLTSSVEYDPWADINGDGKIDILDVVSTTSIYGSSGDPTRNVNVTNAFFEILLTQHGLAVNLATKRNIANGESHLYDQSISGYTYLNYALNCSYGSVKYSVIWIIGGVEWVHGEVIILTAGNTRHSAFPTYGDTIRFVVTGLENSVYSLGIYANNQ